MIKLLIFDYLAFDDLVSSRLHSQGPEFYLRGLPGQRTPAFWSVSHCPIYTNHIFATTHTSELCILIGVFAYLVIFVFVLVVLSL